MPDEFRSIFEAHPHWSSDYHVATRRATERIVDDRARWPRFVPLAFAPVSFRSKLERYRSEELARWRMPRLGRTAGRRTLRRQIPDSTGMRFFFAAV